MRKREPEPEIHHIRTEDPGDGLTDEQRRDVADQHARQFEMLDRFEAELVEWERARVRRRARRADERNRG